LAFARLPNEDEALEKIILKMKIGEKKADFKVRRVLIHE
jgi:hypothetical protein